MVSTLIMHDFLKMFAMIHRRYIGKALKLIYVYVLAKQYKLWHSYVVSDKSN